MSRSERLWFAVAGLLVVTAAGVVVVGSLSAPLGYDEAYNLQIPVHLASEGRYATAGTVFSRPELGLFDHFITTGPTLLLPTAGVLAITPDEVWSARAAAAAFYLLLLVLAAQAGHRLGGAWAALAAAAGALSLDLRTDDGLGMNGATAVLGEIPAAVCILGGALVVTRRPFAAGALVGLAVLSKLIAVLALPAFLAALILARRRDPAAGSLLPETVRLVAGSGLVVTCWCALQVAVLGWTDWLDRSERFIRLFVLGGSGLVEDVTYQFARWPTFADSWSSWQAAALLVLGVATLLALSTFRVGLGRRRQRLTPEQMGLLVAAGGTAGLTLLWWWALAGRVLARYLVTPLLLATVLGCAAGVVAARQLIRSGSWPLAALSGVPAVIALVVLINGHVLAAWSDHDELEEQRRVAAVVHEAGDGRVGGVGWFQNPEIAFLTGRASIGDPASGDLLLLSGDQERLQPEEYRSARERCGEILVRSVSHLLCRVR